MKSHQSKKKIKTMASKEIEWKKCRRCDDGGFLPGKLNKSIPRKCDSCCGTGKVKKEKR
jgi:DnaJ-class molecular chaperone